MTEPTTVATGSQEAVVLPDPQGRQQAWVGEYKAVRGCSGPELLAELQKCEVLCANCHRQHHYEVPEYVGDAEIEDALASAD